MFTEIENFFIEKFIWFTNEHPVIFIALLVGIPFYIFACLLNKTKDFGEFILRKLHHINMPTAKSSWHDYNVLYKKIKKDVKKELKKLPKNYWYEEDVCLIDGDNKIYFDFIVFSDKLICPIIIQNIRGVLNGSLNYKTLSHTIIDNDKYEVQNPFMDCSERKRLLINFLKLDTKTTLITPLVVFSDECRLAIPYTFNFINVSKLMRVLLTFPHTGVNQNIALTLHKKIMINSIKSKKIRKNIKHQVDEDKIKDYIKK